MLTSQAVHLVRIVRCGGRTEASPDRLYLASILLPAFSKLGPRLLWVGVRRYTSGYYAALERDGAECWTLDVDPQAAGWGRRTRHVTGDLLHDKIFPRGATFSAILCNGVFGYGINDEVQQEAAIQRLAALLEPGGWLLLGWNTHNCRDPIPLLGRAPLVHQRLESLAPRTTIRGTTHVFDLLRRGMRS
jgi:hypothetical protein